MPGITIVRSKEDALAAVRVLKQYGNHICAWDTETTGVDPKVESPVGKGSLLCATAFCGPEVNFGKELGGLFTFFFVFNGFFIFL